MGFFNGYRRSRPEWTPTSCLARPEHVGKVWLVYPSNEVPSERIPEHLRDLKDISPFYFCIRNYRHDLANKETYLNVAALRVQPAEEEPVPLVQIQTETIARLFEEPLVSNIWRIRSVTDPKTLTILYLKGLV